MKIQNEWAEVERLITVEQAFKESQKRLEQIRRRKKLLTFAVACSIVAAVGCFFFIIGLVVFKNLPELI